MQKELRRSQNALIITGLGTIALSLWSILKTVLFIELDSENFEALFKSILGEIYERRMAIFVIFFLLAIDLAFRLYVGLKARSEGHGKSGGRFYLLVDTVFMLLCVYDIVYFFTADPELLSFAGSNTSIVFELTSLYTYADLFYASLRTKKLRKQLKEEA